MKNKRKSIAGFIAAIIVLLLIAIGVAFVFKFTNGFNEDFKTFYLTHNEKTITAKKTKQAFSTNEVVRYNVDYTFEAGKEESELDYSVKIIPNAETDFEYLIDENRYLWSDTGDLSQAFSLKKDKAYFTFTIPTSDEVRPLLLKRNAGKSVWAPLVENLESPYLYSLVVSSYDGRITYTVDFKISALPKEEPTEPVEDEYIKIDYEIVSSYNETALTVDCPQKALSGSMISFRIYPEVVLSGHTIAVDVRSIKSGELVGNASQLMPGSFMLTVPDCDILLEIYYV